jgi:putative NADH-flavin reductase
MTSVNVDSSLAKEERNALLSLIRELDSELVKKGRRCLVCCGHGSISILENGKLVEHSDSERYFARKTL